MGRKFRILLAPIGVSTGDGRRFAPGSIETQPPPLPLEYAREKGAGHDGSVVVAPLREVEVTDAGVWAVGEALDVDREKMPDLAEAVAEAFHLLEQGVLGPSVDLDSFDAIPVREGTDTPLEESDWDDPDLRVELLVTRGRVRAATLVSIPAFVETNHTFQWLEDAADDADTAAETTEAAALVASTAVTAPYRAADFVPPVPITGPTPITYDWENGVVYGHIAEWGVCHVGIPDACTTAPKGGDYLGFHTHRIDTDAGPAWAGRLTVGGFHPDLSLSAHAVRRAHDDKQTAAYVQARDDEFGILICGPIADGLDDHTVRVLSRRKVSGDWRETSDGLSLVEILALSPGPRLMSEPGFPVGLRVTAGRQTALVASLGPSPEGAPQRVDYLEIGREIAAVLRAEQKAEAESREALAALDEVLAADAAVARAELAQMLEA